MSKEEYPISTIYLILGWLHDGHSAQNMHFRLYEYKMREKDDDKCEARWIWCVYCIGNLSEVYGVSLFWTLCGRQALNDSANHIWKSRPQHFHVCMRDQDEPVNHYFRTIPCGCVNWCQLVLVSSGFPTGFLGAGRAQVLGGCLGIRCWVRDVHLVASGSCRHDSNIRTTTMIACQLDKQQEATILGKTNQKRLGFGAFLSWRRSM